MPEQPQRHSRIPERQRGENQHILSLAGDFPKFRMAFRQQALLFGSAQALGRILKNAGRQQGKHAAGRNPAPFARPRRILGQAQQQDPQQGEYP